jgi:hypothetical protein
VEELLSFLRWLPDRQRLLGCRAILGRFSPGGRSPLWATGKPSNAALYPCTFFSRMELSTRSVTGQMATQIPNRSA